MLNDTFFDISKKLFIVRIANSKNCEKNKNNFLCRDFVSYICKIIYVKKFQINKIEIRIQNSKNFSKKKSIKFELVTQILYVFQVFRNWKWHKFNFEQSINAKFDREFLHKRRELNVQQKMLINWYKKHREIFSNVVYVNDINFALFNYKF